MSLSTSTDILQLASLISTNTKMLHDFFLSHNLPLPSLDCNAPACPQISPEAADIQEARRTVIEATEQLRALMKGPAELLLVDVRSSYLFPFSVTVHSFVDRHNLVHC